MARLQGNIFSGALTKLTALAVAILGDQGEQITSHLHGKWYQQAAKARVFVGSTLIAGTVIPVNANNLVSTFTLYNPVGSGVNVELINYKLGLAGTTTAVIGNVGLAYQNVAATTALATTTAVTPTNALLGAVTAAKALLYSAATFTGTPTFLQTLGLSFGTTGATPGPAVAMADFDGTIVLQPGYAITVIGNAAQTQAMSQALTWAEVPLTTA